MEMKSWDELVFGISKHPLRYGLNLEVGNGQVVPEIKYFPKRDGEEDSEKMKKEFKEITSNVLKRAVDLGLPSIQLETEQTFVITKNPKLGGEITSIQKSIMEKYAEEYGLKSALRVTVADVRKLEGDMRGSEEASLIFESFEKVAENGADVISIESIGGKEIFNYSLIRQDIEGVLFSVGVLGSLDMEFLWREIVRIADKRGVVPGGDTDCAHGNTAMVLANGLTSHVLSHTFAAVVRAIGASRSLVAYEQGATGPGKDCGYENVIVKAITGLPMSMEGKSSASAHSSLVGNVAAAACDLWSNEQVENVKLYGGWGPQVFLEILGYDTFLMNNALRTGFGKKMRGLLVAANPFDPQVLVLAPNGAWRIGEAITRYPKDYYLRAREACVEALKVIGDGYETRNRELPPNETRACLRIRESCEKSSLSQNAFIEKNLAYFAGRIKNFSKENYGL
jgi:methanol--5-hydroxybenzimidazolylcobamide Co-methyltransferase